EAVAELVHLDARLGDPVEERGRAGPRLLAALARRGEDDPVDLEPGVRPRQREQRPAAPDLDVVRVAADREDATRRPGCREVQHALAGSYTCRRSRRRSCQGAWPDSCIVSRRWRSLIVSITPKNPSYGYATSSPSAMRRANVSSTSSCPGSMRSTISR